MPDPIKPSQPTTWLRLRRLLQFEGNLGGLHYSARIRVLELNAPASLPDGNEIQPAQDQLPSSGSAIVPPAAAPEN